MRLPKPALISPIYAAVFGLTWLLHDVEELRELRQFQPPPPLPQLGWKGQAHMRRAVSVMGIMVAGVTALGVVSGGRHPLFRAVNRANLLHAFWHLAVSAALRHRTPGVMTAATLVLPTALQTERALAEAGHTPPPIRAYALFPAALVSAHILAWLWGRLSHSRRTFTD